MSDYLVITGMSGAGRSTAAAALEDAGWYVIDNMPPSLLAEAAEALSAHGRPQERVALVVGRGGGAPVDEALPAVEALRAQGHAVRLVFLDAPDEILVRRFAGTRRRHPMGGDPVDLAIAEERRHLRAVRERADVVLDTGSLTVNQLRVRIMALFGDPGSPGPRTTVLSFGYAHGVPLDADLVLDCRFLPNPYWVEELRPQSGLDEPVRRYVLEQPETTAFLEELQRLFDLLLPAFQREGKSYLTIALGCTGGRHRSVALAEEVAGRLQAAGWSAGVLHRDVER
ncbi:RNase adapter RapZ [Aciditerrimonas ferrireducens]|nr:RNase adapter RapZ [Aciditerrimonas ferrireducens]MCK4176771.1 RNase adapter RapZ [Aciditerrimonas ferrireducens]